MEIATDVVYRDARTRVTATALELTADELDTVLPACPQWTVRDLLAHLTGVAADIVAGRVAGAPGQDWTAVQVADRRGRALPDVLAEWDRTGPHVEARLAERQLPLQVVLDLLTHEADLHEGLGRGPTDGWRPLLELIATSVTQRAATGTLVLHVDGRTYRGGQGEPVTELTVEPYELFRGLISRRSRAQMRAWDWVGDPAPYLESIPVFGPRDDDQPSRPVSH